MSSPVYLVGMAVAALLAWACLIALLVYFEPLTAGLSILTLFYLSLFIGVSGTLFFIGFSWRRISQPRGIAFQQANTSFRQAILLAIILVGALILQSQRMLNWGSLLALVAIVGLVEWWATSSS
jgi:hypothetical protein